MTLHPRQVILRGHEQYDLRCDNPNGRSGTLKASAENLNKLAGTLETTEEARKQFCVDSNGVDKPDDPGDWALVKCGVDNTAIWTQSYVRLPDMLSILSTLPMHCFLPSGTDVSRNVLTGLLP